MEKPFARRFRFPIHQSRFTARWGAQDALFASSLRHHVRVSQNEIVIFQNFPHQNLAIPRYYLVVDSSRRATNFRVGSKVWSLGSTGVLNINESPQVAVEHCAAPTALGFGSARTQNCRPGLQYVAPPALGLDQSLPKPNHESWKPLAAFRVPEPA